MKCTIVNQPLSVRFFSTFEKFSTFTILSILSFFLSFWSIFANVLGPFSSQNNIFIFRKSFFFLSFLFNNSFLLNNLKGFYLFIYLFIYFLLSLWRNSEVYHIISSIWVGCGCYQKENIFLLKIVKIKCMYRCVGV